VLREFQRCLIESVGRQHGRFSLRCKVVFERDRFAENDVASTELLAFEAVELLEDVDDSKVGDVAAHHHVRNVANFKEPFIVDGDREYVHILAVLLQRGLVGLEEPLDTDVGDGRVVELATADAQIVLKEEKEAVLVDDFANHGLVDEAPLQRLVPGPLCQHVANFLKDFLQYFGGR